MTESRGVLMIVDDDKSVIDALKLVLKNEFEEIISTTEPARVNALCERTEPDVLLCDMNFARLNTDGSEGLRLIRDFKQRFDWIPVVAMTAYSDVDLAVRSVKAGASDFIEKPWNNQRLIQVLKNQVKLQRSQENIRRLRSLQSHEQAQPDLGFVGESSAIRLIREKIRKIADSDANVLILGENGTGKDLVARAIHQLSARSASSFVKIDLGSIHEQLFEAELFGARKGAYTGLYEHRIGRIAQANGGSLFLDELGNLPVNLQVKLLSVLQNREFTMVGGTKAEKIDIRLISATNVSIRHLLDESKFRQDLLYRVNTIEINLPPLRDRKEDIPVLMEFFLIQFAEKYRKFTMKFDSRTMRFAEEYEWPGNVRELQHAIERAVILTDGNTIKAEDVLPLSSLNQSSNTEQDLNLENMEVTSIQKALKQTGGNVARASDLLGITRSALYRRMEKYKL